MLPEAHSRCYQEFKHLLQQLQVVVALETLDRMLLRSEVSQMQQFFQSRIVPLDVEDLDADLSSQVQSYRTEMHKQLRLLGMDVMFLQAAKHSTTTQQRQTQLDERICILIRYCEAILLKSQA